MAKSLGMFVTNSKNMRHVMGIAKAAVAKGSKVKIFFTWKGTLLCKDPEFPALCKMTDVYICADSYKKMGYDPVNDIPEGLDEKRMSTQASFGDIIENYDRCVTL